MARRPRPHDAAVAVGVPLVFATLAAGLALAVPSSAADRPEAPVTRPVAPMATPTPPVQLPGPDHGGIPIPNQTHAEEGIGVAVDAARRPLSGSDVKVVSRVDTKKPVYFITVDDGTWKTRSALRVVRQHRIPITVFLTSSAIGQQADYFRRITRFGGSVQNHTYNHEYLNRPATDLQAAVCGIQERYATLFGTAPWMLRPPGGFGYDSTALHEVAASCGIDEIVMWNVVVTDTGVQYVRPPLRRGDIVILHFTKGLGPALERVLAMGRKQGLRPASLADYLPEPRVRR
jgi:peptidoglycan/xylan/chitin deacetylase (PgdA/CDA1 family)